VSGQNRRRQQLLGLRIPDFPGVLAGAHRHQLLQREPIRSASRAGAASTAIVALLLVGFLLQFVLNALGH